MKRIIFCSAVWLALGACVDNETSYGTGVRVSVSGEEASRGGLPVGSGDDVIELADGWTLEFRRVLVAIEGFELRAADGDSAGVEADPVVADLHLGEPELWTFDEVGSRRWDRVGYRYRAPGHFNGEGHCEYRVR